MPATIGISSGDPAGIGLEVLFKALPPLLDAARWVLFTDRPTFDRHYTRFGNGLPYRWIGGAPEAPAGAGLFAVEVPGAHGAIGWGEISAEAGRRAMAYLEAASGAALAGHLAALVTAPVSKQAAGPGFTGQTDFLASRARVQQYAMAFFAPTFKVVLATVHASLRDALARIAALDYAALIEFVHREFERFGFPNPRIAVAGVNPHAGEAGMFGREELELLTPAVERSAAKGIRVSGPYPADSLYYRAHTGEFDVVIAPYHDQGLIPIKLVAHGEAANVTLGLPYVRTSPDHGTAFEIAGQGVADPSGMRSALQWALRLAGKMRRI